MGKTTKDKDAAAVTTIMDRYKAMKKTLDAYAKSMDRPWKHEKALLKLGTQLKAQQQELVALLK